MRTTLVAISIRILAGALLSAPAPAFAQEEPIIVATVPFDFTVGNQHLSAGKYVVRPESNDPSVVWIERTDSRDAAVARTAFAKKRDGGAKFFHRNSTDRFERALLDRRNGGGRSQKVDQPPGQFGILRVGANASGEHRHPLHRLR